ncbi:MAG: hypothetical protein NTW82_10900 [Bacteroidia bacterium]|nr:hypothetical protein [Bacteroidia bacterium]
MSKGKTTNLDFPGITKTVNFDTDGNETRVDYVKMMKIIADSKYSGYIYVEYEGTKQ